VPWLFALANLILSNVINKVFSSPLLLDHPLHIHIPHAKHRLYPKTLSRHAETTRPTHGACHMAHVTWRMSHGACHMAHVTWRMSRPCISTIPLSSKEEIRQQQEHRCFSNIAGSSVSRTSCTTCNDGGYKLSCSGPADLAAWQEESNTLLLA
jgi:hypothetical protein